MTTIEELENEINDIIKRNEETDFENKIRDECYEFYNNHFKCASLGFLGLCLILFITTVIVMHAVTTSDIKTHALAAKNITEYIISLKV